MMFHVERWLANVSRETNEGDVTNVSRGTLQVLTTVNLFL